MSSLLASLWWCLIWRRGIAWLQSNAFSRWWWWQRWQRKQLGWLTNCKITTQCLFKIGDYGLGRAAFPNDYWPLLRSENNYSGGGNVAMWQCGNVAMIHKKGGMRLLTYEHTIQRKKYQIWPRFIWPGRVFLWDGQHRANLRGSCTTLFRLIRSLRWWTDMRLVLVAMVVRAQ